MAKASPTLRLEMDVSIFIADTAVLDCQQTGRLVRMLIAEALKEDVPPAPDLWVAEIWERRSDFRRIRGRTIKPTLPLELRRLIYDRDEGICAYCARAISWVEYHCDHVVPVARGGSSAPENLTAACIFCNLSKGTKLLSEWRP